MKLAAISKSISLAFHPLEFLVKIWNVLQFNSMALSTDVSIDP